MHAMIIARIHKAAMDTTPNPRENIEQTRNAARNAMDHSTKPETPKNKKKVCGQ